MNCFLYHNCEEPLPFFKTFYGHIITDLEIVDELEELSEESIVYVCGDLSKLKVEPRYIVIEEYSINIPSWAFIGHEDMLPIELHGFGVYFKRFFSKDYFDLISTSHNFQDLTESNKGDLSLRKGIYLSEVQTTANNELTFNLLRCSTNLNGPTEAFNHYDKNILLVLNYFRRVLFPDTAEFNHVLAQIYYNYREGKKERKARISDHSDKTKDMPDNGMMAFCTFYDRRLVAEAELTRIIFTDKITNHQFVIPLHQKSVLFITLATNRLYTHKISPSIMPAEKLPKRMGYIVRCSKTVATYKNNQVYINDEPLREHTEEEFKLLKELYAE